MRKIQETRNLRSKKSENQKQTTWKTTSFCTETLAVETRTKWRKKTLTGGIGFFPHGKPSFLFWEGKIPGIKEAGRIKGNSKIFSLRHAPFQCLWIGLFPLCFSSQAALFPTPLRRSAEVVLPPLMNSKKIVTAKVLRQI
ncbi:hypothetical protein CEXT_61751 [Caerostris extrusa]|uniref:Uncharacterized protein n=1 Tax=Caerostris extrusa TaxID=172846 RepID=A0AAV4Y6I3_CAEEX|nr:hypothetical protein CEXT_61751 [Caerostris extrusa]